MTRLVAACLLLWPSLAFPQPTCEALEGPERDLVRELLNKLESYDNPCCHGTLSHCLAHSSCKLAVRLSEDLCRQVKAGREKTAILKAYDQRARSMVGVPRDFLLDESMMAGDAKAPVSVVVFACSRCPYCKQLVGELYQAITEGALKGKARLYLKPFPLKSHPEAADGDRALMTAQKLGKLWPFTRTLYSHFDEFDVKKLPVWAEEAGLDRAAFEKVFADEKTRDALTESKKEGLKYKVIATPTLFIDGREFVYDLKIAPILDLVDEEHERVTTPRPPKAP